MIDIDNLMRVMSALRAGGVKEAKISNGDELVHMTFFDYKTDEIYFKDPEPEKKTRPEMRPTNDEILLNPYVGI